MELIGKLCQSNISSLVDVLFEMIQQIFDDPNALRSITWAIKQASNFRLYVLHFKLIENYIFYLIVTTLKPIRFLY